MIRNLLPSIYWGSESPLRRAEDHPFFTLQREMKKMFDDVFRPTKVARFALQNAASVASLMLTTEAMVAEKPKKKGSPAPAMPPDMGDYN